MFFGVISDITRIGEHFGEAFGGSKRFHGTSCATCTAIGRKKRNQLPHQKRPYVADKIPYCNPLGTQLHASALKSTTRAFCVYDPLQKGSKEAIDRMSAVFTKRLFYEHVRIVSVPDLVRSGGKAAASRWLLDGIEPCDRIILCTSGHVDVFPEHISTKCSFIFLAEMSREIVSSMDGVSISAQSTSLFFNKMCSKIESNDSHLRVSELAGLLPGVHWASSSGSDPFFGI
jgi:hypothetical protein